MSAYQLPTTFPATTAFAERLRAAVAADGRNLRELEDDSGVSKDTISRWQRAEDSNPASVKVERLVLLAAELGVEAGELLGLPAPSPSNSEREALLVELQEEIENLERPVAELTAQLSTLEALTKTLPELRQLASRALRS